MSKNRKIVLSVIALVIAGALVWYYSYNKPQPKQQKSYHATIHQLPNSPSTNINSSKSLSPSSGVNQGSSTNNINSVQITTSPNQWASSSSGNIVLQDPIANQTISSGFYLIGTANVPTVFYNLLDNQVGVISTNSINVINGKFSAVVNFKPVSQSGRLDVYSTDPNGKEINLIEIPVNFN
jgi:hypothetical protein